MPETMLSRRGLMGAGLLAVTAAGTRLSAARSSCQTIFETADFGDYSRFAEGFRESLENANNFLDVMMDAYARGNTVRLSQSYSDGGLLSTGFTYDNALAIHAYLARGTSADLSRAEILGDGLLVAQATNFPFHDGRFAQAYFTNAPNGSGAYVTPAAAPFYFYTSATGDQAWAGLALAHLYVSTGDNAYLNGAVSVANWIVNNHYDTRGPGGYSWGTNINPTNQSVPSPNGKSTEHNIDVYAFFTLLPQLTNGGHAQNGMSWTSLADHALQFIKAMWNPAGGFFYVGTVSADNNAVSTSPIAEDVQTWSFLALLNKSYGVSIDWATTHLINIDTPSCPNTAMSSLGNIRIEGMTFDTASLSTNPANNDPHAVWLEGSGHTATALITRREFTMDDIVQAYRLLENIRLAQQNLGKGQTVNGAAFPSDAQGIVASTGNLDTGFGYDYYPSLHIGATSWYVLALLGANPYQLGYGLVC